MPGLALTSAAAGVAILAELERARLVRPPDGPPTGAGAAVALPGTEPPTTEAGVEDSAAAPRPGGLIAVDRDLGLSLFEVDRSRFEAFELIPPAAVPSGSYVAAVTRDRTGRAAITPGHLVSARAAPDGLSLRVSMRLTGPGATAVVDLDGALVGVAVDLGTGAELRLLSSSVVRQVVAELQRRVRCRALVVSELEPPVLALLGVERGVLIQQVRQEAFVPEPSLHAGDVLLEWDGEAVSTVEPFETATDALAHERARAIPGAARTSPASGGHGPARSRLSPARRAAGPTGRLRSRVALDHRRSGRGR